MKTKNQKIQYLIDNTKYLNEKQKNFFHNYLYTRLNFKTFTHKEIDEFVSYCKETNGGCLLQEIFG